MVFFLNPNEKRRGGAFNLQGMPHNIKREMVSFSLHIDI